MFAIQPEVYTNNNIELRVFDLNGTMRYWVKGGVGYIEFDQDQFAALLELLLEFDKEKKVNGRRFHGVRSGIGEFAQRLGSRKRNRQ